MRARRSVVCHSLMCGSNTIRVVNIIHHFLHRIHCLLYQIRYLYLYHNHQDLVPSKQRLHFDFCPPEL